MPKASTNYFNGSSEMSVPPPSCYHVSLSLDRLSPRVRSIPHKAAYHTHTFNTLPHIVLPPTLRARTHQQGARNNTNTMPQSVTTRSPLSQPTHPRSLRYGGGSMGSGLVNFPASTGGYPRKLLMNSQDKKRRVQDHSSLSFMASQGYVLVVCLEQTATPVRPVCLEAVQQPRDELATWADVC